MTEVFEQFIPRGPWIDVLQRGDCPPGERLYELATAGLIDEMVSAAADPKHELARQIPVSVLERLARRTGQQGDDGTQRPTAERASGPWSDFALIPCRAAELAAESAAGQIRGYLRQVTFRLGCEENRYRADFVVFGPDGIAWAEDVKGFETPAFLEVRRLWARYGPCPLIILKRRGKGWRREEVRSERL